MHTIKRLFFSVLLVCCAANMMAQQEDKVIVHLKDGKQAEYLMQDVDYIEMQTPETAVDPSLETVGGTVGEAINLGLSVDWADHNLGASTVGSVGGYWSANDEALGSWGEGWRVPTQEEWQELYDKCSWNWVVYNGRGCRMVSTTTGSIILPAAGVVMGDETFISGGVGVYLVDNNNDTASENVASAYFDSANIYWMEFPKTNRFSVRLVKDKGWGYSKK